MVPLVVSAILAAAAANAGPLDKADAGFVQCYEPDDTGKTCASMAAYKRNADGTWNNIAIINLSPSQAITLETETIVHVKDGAVCGTIRTEDVMKGHLRITGDLIPADKAAAGLAKIAEAMAPLLNKEICTVYVPGPHDLVALSTVAGSTTPGQDQRVRWVLASDGYAVGPAVAGSAAKP